MGGFVLLHTAPGEDRSPAQTAALAAFARMGMPTPRLVQGANFLLAVYPKRQESEPAFEQFSNGDFVCACGTLIYEDMVGKPAAAAFYRDCREGTAPRDKALGHYAVILHKDGETEIVVDGFGGFLVFYDAARRIASSSFLAIASVLDRVTLALRAPANTSSTAWYPAMPRCLTRCCSHRLTRRLLWEKSAWRSWLTGCLRQRRFPPSRSKRWLSTACSSSTAISRRSRRVSGTG